MVMQARAAPAQESVWDYPQTPRLEPFAGRVRVEFAGRTIADTTRAVRCLEKGLPPTYYIPPEDVTTEALEKTARTSVCPYKGEAAYYTVRVGDRVAENAAWAYPDPIPAFRELTGHFAFYAHNMDACYVGEERIAPRKKGFYGGWITSSLKDESFKGD